MMNNAPLYGKALPTHLVRPQDIQAIIQRQGIATTFHGIVDYLLQDYLAWDSFEKTARIASHHPNGVLELMPIANHSHYSFKYVNCHPSNPTHGLSTVLAFGALMNANTGQPEVISELTLTTALRTASMSVLAARYLARPNSRRMAIIGNGCQSDFQALAFHHLLGIQELALYDIDPAASQKLKHNLRHTDLKIEIFDSVAQAVKGADIITTITAEYATAHILTADMIEKGVHINAVGGDSPGKTELDPTILTMGPVFIEFEPQTRAEGELQHQPASFKVNHLYQVFAGQTPGRQNDQEITIFDSVGFALEDYSALRYMADTAKRLGLWQVIEVTPDLDNPKDLFGYLTGASSHTQQSAA